MTSKEIIAHWLKGARDALAAAKLCYGDKRYELALFHCHLSVEKALKVRYMETKKEMPPYSHDLEFLARELPLTLTDDQSDLLRELSDYAIESRYSDPVWAEGEATAEKTGIRLKRTEDLLLTLLKNV